MNEVELSSGELRELHTLLRIARDHIEDCARQMRAFAKTEGNPMITPEGAKKLAEIHEYNARIAKTLIRRFDDAETVWIQKPRTDPED